MFGAEKIRKSASGDYETFAFLYYGGKGLGARLWRSTGLITELYISIYSCILINGQIATCKLIMSTLYHAVWISWMRASIVSVLTSNPIWILRFNLCLRFLRFNNDVANDSCSDISKPQSQRLSLIK